MQGHGPVIYSMADPWEFHLVSLSFRQQFYIYLLVLFIKFFNKMSMESCILGTNSEENKSNHLAIWLKFEGMPSHTDLLGRGWKIYRQDI